MPNYTLYVGVHVMNNHSQDAEKGKATQQHNRKTKQHNTNLPKTVIFQR